MHQLKIKNKQSILPIILIIFGLIQLVYGFINLLIEQYNNFDIILFLYTTPLIFILFYFELRIANRLFSKFIFIELAEQFFIYKIGLRSHKIALDRIKSFHFKNNDDFTVWEQFEAKKFKDQAIEMNHTLTYLFNINNGWRLYFDFEEKKAKRILNSLSKDDALRLKEFLTSNLGKI